MATPTRKSIAFEDVNISYTTYNLSNATPGKPVICFLHGWCCSADLWSSQSPLYNHYPSILIDLPGHGQSAKPENVDYSCDFFARSVNAVLEAENVAQVVIVAHSMGGFISTMVLRLYGEQKVKGIVYCSSFWLMPAHYLTVTQRHQWREALKDDESFFGIFNERWTSKSSKSMIERIRKTMCDETPLHVRLSAATTNSLPHHWRWDEVYAKTPMLHITSTNETDWYEQYRHHLPNLVTEKWEDVSIFLFMEEPERFNERVETFLKEHKLLP